MRTLALIFAMALFVSRSTIVVKAFQPRPRLVRITTCTSHGYHCLSKLAITHNNKDNGEIRSLPSSRLFAVSSDHSPKKKQGPIRRLFKTALAFLRSPNRFSRRLRSWVVSVALFCAIQFSVLDPAWAAGSNGRMGGSFGRSDRYRSPPITRHSRPSGVDRRIRNYQQRPAPIRVMSIPRRSTRNRVYHNFHQANGEQISGDGVSIMTNPDGTTNHVRKHNTHPFSDSRFSASDVVLAAGVTAVVANGVVKRNSDRNKYDDENPFGHPLGPGVSVWCLTACLNVSDLTEPTSIVRRLQRLAETTSTETRKGLQTLLAETSLELSRQLDKGTVASVESKYNHYRSSDQAVVRAERQYNRISTRERSKFDRESWSSYNGKVVEDDIGEREKLSPSFASNGAATFALVQIHLVIEGDSMKAFGQRQIETRKSLREALVQLSGDVTAVEDCVVAGEVLWAPQLQERQEVMTEENVYANYPTLWPLDYTI